MGTEGRRQKGKKVGTEVEREKRGQAKKGGQPGKKDSKETAKKEDCQVERQRNRQVGKQADRWTVKQAGRKPHRQ